MNNLLLSELPTEKDVPPNNDRNINKTNLKVIKLLNEQSSSRLCLPKLMITNARSLLNKHDEAYSVTVANGVDLFAVTETWLHSQVPDEVISMPSFQLIRKDRMTVVVGEFAVM
jgi:hypothetical protein